MKGHFQEYFSGKRQQGWVFNLNRGGWDDIPEADIDWQRNTGVGQAGFKQYSDAFVCLFIADLFDADGVGQEGHAIVFHVLPTHLREHLAYRWC